MKTSLTTQEFIKPAFIILELKDILHNFKTFLEAIDPSLYKPTPEILQKSVDFIQNMLDATVTDWYSTMVFLSQHKEDEGFPEKERVAREDMERIKNVLANMKQKFILWQRRDPKGSNEAFYSSCIQWIDANSAAIDTVIENMLVKKFVPFAKVPRT